MCVMLWSLLSRGGKGMPHNGRRGVENFLPYDKLGNLA